MKMIKDKKLLVGADVAGFYLKEAICEHLRNKGWEITDIGAKSIDDKDTEMFHRMAIRVASKVCEKEFERALLFCGTGQGVHLAANKVPNVQCAVVESVAAAERAITGNGADIIAMGGHYVTHQMGIEIADIFLKSDIGTGYEWWPNFYEFHKLAHDEIDAFDYEEYKANGFEVKRLGDVDLPYDCINDNE